MSSGKKLSLKAGDLISTGGVIGLVLGPGYVSPIIRGVETMKVWWSDENEPTEIDTIANTVKMTNPGIDPDSVGLVVQQGIDLPCRQGEEYASCWVQWAGRSDWDEMFIQDMKIC